MHKIIAKLAILSFACLLVSAVSVTTTLAQQSADPDFDARVENPAYAKNFPRVLFDEAHNNVDTSTGRYKPFADLIFNDGYHLVVNRQPLNKATMMTFKILVIANPLGAEDLDEDTAGEPAFTPEECDTVVEWIRAGGSLLFIADHAPFGSAAEILATKLGVEMSKGYTSDPANTDKEANDPGVIIYTRENRSLAEHSITNGRSEAERLKRVMTFSGQSLKGPTESEAFLKLAGTAVDRLVPSGKTESAAGRGQGIAFRLGKGRVVVLGDAATISAQTTGSDKKIFGMNVPDIDNKQLALNIMHWLSGLLK